MVGGPRKKEKTRKKEGKKKKKALKMSQTPTPGSLVLAECRSTSTSLCSLHVGGPDSDIHNSRTTFCVIHTQGPPFLFFLSFFFSLCKPQAESAAHICCCCCCCSRLVEGALFAASVSARTMGGGEKEREGRKEERTEKC